MRSLHKLAFIVLLVVVVSNSVLVGAEKLVKKNEEPKVDTKKASVSAMETFARMQVERNRRQNTTEMPAWLRKNYGVFHDALAAEAKKSFKETGIWFLSRGASRNTAEQETYAVWTELLAMDGLENLPGYSKENHQQAIEFWRSWQNLKTGRLYNPLYQDPQNPEIKRNIPGNRSNYSPAEINTKYVVEILAKLGSELPKPVNIASRADNTADTFDQLWAHIARWETSPSGMLVAIAAREVGKGNLEKIPQVEAGMGALIRRYNRKTGMWRPEPLENFPWAAYEPSSGFKIIARICGYVGMENFPEDILKTSVNNLLAHKSELYGDVSTARNYSETMIHYLVLADYRREELLDAVGDCLGGFRDVTLWEKTGTSSYCIFGSNLIGAFMNWQNKPYANMSAPWYCFEHGCEIPYRFVVGPYGNWVNVIPKEPQAIFGHPDYDVDKYGLKARNKVHWAKKITNLNIAFKWSFDPTDDGETKNGTFEFVLTEDQLAMRETLYLRATWSGAYDISLNGEPVKQVRYNLPDHPAGWYIPASAAKTLHAGKNTVEVKLIGPGKDQEPGAPLSKRPPFIRLGLINWKV